MKAITRTKEESYGPVFTGGDRAITASVAEDRDHGDHVVRFPGGESAGRSSESVLGLAGERSLPEEAAVPRPRNTSLITRRVLGFAIAVTAAVLAAVIPASAQPYTLGYFAATTGTSATSPLAGSTQITLTAPHTLTAGMQVLLDRTGANPEVLTVASIASPTSVMLTSGMLSAHVAPFSIDWVTTPGVPVGTVSIPTATCGAAPPIGPVVPVNPSTIAWNDDPSTPGACVAPQSYTANQLAFFAAIPVGDYWAAISNAKGWSNASPFGRALRPPTTFRIVR